MLFLKIQSSYMEKSTTASGTGSRSLGYIFIGQVLSQRTLLFIFSSFVHRRDGAQLLGEFHLGEYSCVDQLSVVLSRFCFQSRLSRLRLLQDTQFPFFNWSISNFFVQVLHILFQAEIDMKIVFESYLWFCLWLKI